jgi:hypothetical protein
LARRIEVEIVGDPRNLERAFRRSGAAGDRFATNMRKAGIAAGVAFAAVGVAAVKGISAASDLNEQINKSKVVFDKSSDAILSWSKTTADAFGLSQRAALEAAGSFGQVFQAAGVTEKQSAKMSKSIVELAADLASFNNIDPAEALDRLRSGLAGETEPLRRVGVFLTAATVQQEAYRLGIAKTGAQLTEGQKIQARYSLIMGQTAKAQGDFGRTSGSLANALRRVRAQFEDLVAGLGSKILPAVAGAVDKFSDFIAEFGRARTFRAKLDVVIDNVRGVARDLVDKLGDIVAAIDWSAIWDRATGFAEALQKQIDKVDWSAVGRTIGDAFAQAARAAVPKVKELVTRITATVRGINWEDLGREMGPGLATALLTAFNSLLDPGFWVRNWDLVLSVALVAFGGPVTRLGGKLGAFLVKPFVRVGGDMVLAIASGIERGAPRLAELFLRIVNRIPGLLLKALAPIANIVRKVFARIGRLAAFTVKVLGLQAVINQVVAFGRDVLNEFKLIGRKIGEIFKSAFDFVIRKLLEFANKFLKVTSFLGPFDPFKGLRKKLQTQLDNMTRDSETAAGQIQANLNSIVGPNVTITVGVVTGPVTAPGIAPSRVTSRGGGDFGIGDAAKSITDALDDATKFYKSKVDAAIKRGRKRIEATKKAFPGLIDNLELAFDEAEVTKGFADDRRAAQAIINAIQEEIRIEGKTPELARQLFDARQRLAQVGQNQTEAANNAFVDFTSGLSSAVQRAVDSGNWNKALRLNSELQAKIRKQIQAEGKTAELQDQLFAARQERVQINQRKDEAIKAKLQRQQFRALGLGPTGEKPIPTIGNLKKQLVSLRESVKGTALDTPRLEGLMNTIGKVLAGGWGKVTDVTREKIRDMLSAWRDELKSGGDAAGPLTKTTSLSFGKITAGVGGLTREQIKRLKANASNFNSAGVALVGTTLPAGATRGDVFGGGVPIVESHVTIELDGRVITQVVTRGQEKRRRRNPRQKRGPNVPHGI